MSLYIGKDQNSLLERKNAAFRKNYSVKSEKPSFKGGLVNSAFNTLQTSDVLGPAVVDICSMLTPRTLIDYTRGVDAGNETFRRESSSTANVFLPNVYAMGAGALINKFAKTENKLPNLAIDGDTMEVFKNEWQASGSNKATQSQTYAENVLNRVKGTVGEETVTFSKTAKQNIAKEVANLIDEGKSGKELKTELKRITEYAVKELKADKELTLSSGKKSIGTDMKNLIKNMHAMQTKVFNIFPEKNLDSIITNSKAFNKTKSLAGLGTALAVGLSLQPINRYLTKLKTGSSAFVGNPDYDITKGSDEPKESKAGLLAKKALSLAAIGYVTLATITKKMNPKDVLKVKPAKLMQELECKSWIPSLAQLKALYGATVVGRICASSDKNELRETNIRDFSGFFNWLILGEVVAGVTTFALASRNKGGLKIAQVFNGKIEKMPENFFKKTWQIIKKLRPKTHAEIDALKLSDDVAQQAKNITSAGTATGLVYSGLSLGLFIPWLNKYITNKKAAAKHEQSAIKSKEEFDNNKYFLESVLGKLTAEKSKEAPTETLTEYPPAGSFEDNKRLVELSLGKLSE